MKRWRERDYIIEEKRRLKGKGYNEIYIMREGDRLRHKERVLTCVRNYEI